MYGKTLSKETKMKISESTKGKTLTEQHKKRISESRRGIIKCPNQLNIS
jgi:hypothetical protein